ncbi:MAG TPA: chromosomal replication initiator protein DnaA [Desulfobulbaceae bacterium]|nr:chromosomal replication initiator protein DnaA [Desulfobulbaceae bacterium]
MLWETLRESLQESLPESEYSLWIKPLVCQRQDGQVLELAGPDRFFCSWVRDRYLELINRKLSELIIDSPLTVTLAVTPHPLLPIESHNSGQLKLPGVHDHANRLRSLHPGYTFDQFMVGQSNVLARSACQAIAHDDRTFGNCLFINSTTGLGKSHLTQAVVHSVLQNAPGTLMHYLTAQQFSAEMVNGIRAKTMDQFSSKFIHNCDLLLVEDIHTLVGKNKTQEELNMILDYLIKSGKRVILTAGVAPTSLDGIDEDFKSRMASGLVTKIEPPEYSTRISIIRHKAMMYGLLLSDDLVDLLAQNLNGDIRKIESALIGLKAKSTLTDTPPDQTMVREVLSGLITAPERLNGETIRNLVSTQFKVSVDELISRSRKRSVAFPRQVAMYMTRKYTDRSLADIGGLYNRDHSTVLHAIRTITRDISRSTSVSEQIELLDRKLKNK